MMISRYKTLVAAALLLPLAACARTEPVPPAEADEIQAAVNRADQGAREVKTSAEPAQQR